MDEKVRATEIAKRSWSEGIWMYLFHDSALQRGKKHVLVVLAPDRTNPGFDVMSKAFRAVEEELDEIHHLRVFFEDHPGGFLHEKFNVPAQQFIWYLVDIHGDEIARSDQPASVSDIVGQLENADGTPQPRLLS